MKINYVTLLVLILAFLLGGVILKVMYLSMKLILGLAVIALLYTLLKIKYD
jgi:hypothetical protein